MNTVKFWYRLFLEYVTLIAIEIRETIQLSASKAGDWRIKPYIDLKCRKADSVFQNLTRISACPVKKITFSLDSVSIEVFVCFVFVV